MSQTSRPTIPPSPGAAPLLTVAMPVYNGGEFLRFSVLSLIRQTFTDWELLLIDDGSSDQAVQGIAELADPRIKILRDGCNRGLAVRLNEAIALARGRYLARMDHDDLSYPERFARQIEALQQDPGLDLVATRAIMIDEHNQPLGLFPSFISHQEICAQPWRGFYLPHPTWLGRTAWFRQNNYTVPAPYLSEDQELLLRTYRNSRFATLDKILFAYRVRSQVDWRKIGKTRRTILHFQWRYFAGLGCWHLGLLSIATFAAKSGRDLVNRIKRSAVQPGAALMDKGVIAEWENILVDVTTEPKAP